MRRRDILLCASVLCGLLAGRGAHAQAATAVGFLIHGDPDDFFTLNHNHTSHLRRSLCNAGWCGAREAKLIVRAGESAEALAEAAADLVRSDVKAIVAAASAAMRATSRIPIVFYHASDPVAHGLVTSLSRPEGNLTGFAVMEDEITPKLLQFLHELKPEARLVARLFDPEATPEDVRQRLAAQHDVAAERLGLRLRELAVRSRADIEAALPEAKAQGIDALVVEGSTLLFSNRFVVARLAMRHSLPAIYRDRQFATADGLMAYGEDLVDLQRRAAVYVDRLLRGARSGDLPVQQGVEAGVGCEPEGCQGTRARDAAVVPRAR